MRHVALGIEALADAIQPAVGPRGVVHHEHDEVGATRRQLCHGDTRALVVPREPVRHVHEFVR
ncbi:MAG: hypothetical protein ACRDTT_02975, partial [Pseudonocardiaceae bacterium]